MDMKLLDAAIILAARAHSGQFDPDGLPHIVHSMEVMRLAHDEYDVCGDELGYTLEEILCAAILHDVPEDTDTTLDMLRVQFGNNITEIVDGVTRRKDESYRDFIYRAKCNAGSRLIKISDLIHNRRRSAKTAALPASNKLAAWGKKLSYKYEIASSVLNDDHEPTWEGASYRVEYLRFDFDRHNPKFFIADPDGKEIEITKEAAKNVRASFTISN